MKRGPKSRAVALHVVGGTYRPDRHETAANAPEPTGRPVRPKFLKGRAAKVWSEYVGVAFWLTDAESHILAVWCSLTAEIETSVALMPAARISQWRTLAAELGLTPSARARIGGKDGKKKSSKEDPAAEFFDP